MTRIEPVTSANANEQVHLKATDRAIYSEFQNQKFAAEKFTVQADFKKENQLKP